MNPLIQIAIQEVPNLIAWLKETFAKKHPDAPVPTDDEVLAAYESAFAASLAKDEVWLRLHHE